MKNETEQTETEYIPFGDEWLKEMRKFSKEELIQHYRRVCIQLQAEHEQNINNMFKGI